MKKTTHEAASENLIKLFEIFPIDLTTASGKATAEMREGLALAYANNGFRKFMENLVRHINQSLLKSVNQEQMLYYKGQMETALYVMGAGKTLFVDSEIKRQRTDREKAFQVEEASLEANKK